MAPQTKLQSTLQLSENWREWPLEVRHRFLQRLMERSSTEQRPHPRQKEFLNLTCEEAFYGGAAGGGKTEALLMWLAEGVNIPKYSGVFIRRNYQQLMRSNDSPILRSARLYQPMGGKYNQGAHRWTFPSGAVIEFGHMNHENSIMNYQGPSFHRVAFDELTQFSETQYTFLFSRIRSEKDFPIPLGIRATGNPGGIGHEWVKARFVTAKARRVIKSLSYRDLSPPGVFWSNENQRCFVPARVADNPSLDVEDYIKRMLGHLPPRMRAQMANGDWDAVEGSLIDPTWFRHYGMAANMLSALHEVTEHKLWSRDDRTMRRFMVVDTAGSSREKAAQKKGKPSSYSCCGVWDYHRESDTLFLRHVWRERVEWVDLKRQVAAIAKEWEVKDGDVENAHNGPALAAEMKGIVQLRLVGPVLPEMTEGHRDAKLERAIAGGLFERFERGGILLPKMGRVPGIQKWLPEYEGELTSWTGDPDEPNDQIDMTSYACERVGKAKSSWGGVIRG